MLSTLRRLALTCLLAALGLASGAVVAQPPSAQVDRRTEEVRFPSEPGVVLAGTLETPRAFGAGPFPVAIFVSGNGPWARGGFESYRARLLADGIAILQYDKRGIGASTGTFVDTLPVTERDAAAAVAYLRTRRDIDGRRIALIGHSQGAVAAPAVASRDGDVAAVVMLSGPIGARGELFIGIMRSNLAAGGRTEAEIDRIAAATLAWMEARSRRASPDDVAQLRERVVDSFVAARFDRAQAAGAVAPLDTDVVLSLFEAAPDRALADLRAPIMVVYGSADPVIAPERSVAAAQAALSGHRDALVVAIPGLDHSLRRVNAPPEATVPVGGDHAAPIVSEIVGDWLRRRLQAPRRR